MSECLHVPVTALRVLTTLLHIVLSEILGDSMCSFYFITFFAVRIVLHLCVSEECVQIQVMLLRIAPSRAWSSHCPGRHSCLYRPATSVFLLRLAFSLWWLLPRHCTCFRQQNGGGEGCRAGGELPSVISHPLFAGGGGGLVQGAPPSCRMAESRLSQGVLTQEPGESMCLGCAWVLGTELGCEVLQRSTVP